MIEPISWKEPNPPSIDENEFIKVITSRRSVRKFDTNEIPESITKKCLHLASLAPNSSNLHPWEFYWVRNSEKKKALIHACLNQNAAKTASELIVAIARTDTWKRNAKLNLAELSKHSAKTPKILEDYYTKIVPLAYSVGFFSVLAPLKWLIFTLVGIFKPVPREPLHFGDLKTWAVKSTALACENLMLAFRAFGYDTCPMEGLDSRRVKSILGLGCGSVVVMAIAAGKRSEEGIYGPQIRLPENLFIFEV